MKHCVHLKLRIKKALCLAVSAICLLAALTGPAAAEDKQSQLESTKNELQQQLEKEKSELAAIQSTKKKAQATKDSLEKQSTLISSQISVLLDQIAETQAQVAQKQQEVSDKQAEIDQRWADFKARVGAMQQLHDGGAVAMLSSATSLYELLTFNDTLQQISAKDNEVLAEMETARAELAQQQAELEDQQAQLEDQQAQLEDKKVELADNIHQADETITESQAAESVQQQVVDATQSKFNEAANALDAYIRSQNAQYGSSTVYCSKSFIRPTATLKYITTRFGQGGHNGVDLAAPCGTPIYAAADGTVTISAYHYSYGNYVSIYHGADDDGNTYATLYAHMNQAPSVSVGQAVKQGDVIGYVGNTGYSFGYHLHLELRVNGRRVDPLAYIPT